MSRVWLLVPVGVLAFFGCDNGKSKTMEATSAGREAIDKVDKAFDKAMDTLDVDEAKQHLDSAKAAVAKGLDAAEHCAWAAKLADDVIKDAIKDPVTELRRICSFDAPLARATKAVVAAEKAKAEQPEAPSYTECSSDDWAIMKKQIDGSPSAGDARWTELKARWSKICPETH